MAVVSGTRAVKDTMEQLKELSTMELTVCQLIKFPYLKRSLEMQQKITAAGRPALLKNIPMWKGPGLVEKNAPAYDGNSCNPALFELVHWIVFCDKKRKFFCYNCLLYAPSNAILSLRSNAYLPTMVEFARLHEVTEEHMEASIKLQMFIKDNFPTPELPAAPDKKAHNFIVKRNCEVLRRLIDAVYCTVGQKHSHGDGKYTPTLIKVDDCAKFLELLKKVDVSNADLIDDAVDMMERHPRIVNDLVDCITRVVKLAIKKETQQSTYVSVILSEHGMRQSGKSQISSVLRYIKRGKVCEHFVGFTNFIGFHSKETIYKIVRDIIEQYGITERFLALSLDGRVLPKEELAILIATVKVNYKFSYFVPWDSHGFGNTLLQTLYDSDECGCFLKTVHAMEKYFENPKPRESLEFALVNKHTELRANKWYEKSPFIIFVATYRNDFIEFFDSAIKNCKYFETNDISNISSFRGFLQEVQTVFFLQVFKTIFFPSFDETFNFIVDREEKMFVFDNPKIGRFLKHVGSLGFKPVWDIVVTEIKSDSKLAAEMKDEWALDFGIIFHKILRNLYKEIDIRCNYLSRLKFCDLLNCYNTGTFAFIPQLMSVLMTEHGPFFNENDLMCEVPVLNAQPMFQGKSVYELLECFADLNLRNVLPQLYKLAEFILTVPFMPASPDRERSKLKDIDKCSYIPEDILPSGEASFLCIEYEMLEELKESPIFYNDVLAGFYELNKYLLLTQV